MSPTRPASSFTAVALAVASRALHHALTRPELLIPSLIFPLFFLVAFAGGLSTISDVPGFDFPSGYTAFQYVFVFLQSSAFGGVFVGFSVAADFESGFGRRLMLAAPRRSAIVAGYSLAALGRWMLTATVVTVAALLAGMQVDGSAAQLIGLIGLGLLVNIAACLWATGLALRFRSIQAGPLMQMPIFVSLFLAPVYVPLDLLQGWIKTVAEYNPVTLLLEAGRGFISGEPTNVAFAFATAALMALLLATWGVRSMRRAEAAGA